ncbi:carboxylesterase/lipase family protein [Sphingomonas aerophila]|uniref:Carboxylic ester hydrolase n=1 Tax=Sphingomonas aerophila TaxID=1344948 RepID=A0A7W9BFV4_9SPHN|nr:carboxylesterase/lipase family protein [Sphingomonas aerophila]MBB5716427.1 para-nitrobenzyl esterase [Sphingomonas aerophila]
MKAVRARRAACCLFLATTVPVEAAPRAVTRSGLVEGVQEGGVAVFRGIPYVRPPVGPDRWRAPVPAPRWTGVRPATRFGHSCWQAVSPKGFGPWTHEYVVAGDISEDCLFLNVWTPVKRAGPRPVLVWIHGGGFNSGSGAIPIYDGAALAARGAVVVTINYRVGVFGFLSHPELTGEAGGNPPANFGLMDIVAALRWVKANIASFGGDPGAVTIAGQSAGAMAVHELVASPAAKGLFHRAIGESGLPRALTPLDQAEAQGVAFAKEKGAASLAALRAMPAEALQPSQGANAVRFVPVADGRLLPAGPWRAASDVPMLVGLNADEGSALGEDYGSADPAKLSDLLRTSFGPLAGRAAALYPSSTESERAVANEQVRRDRGLGAIDIWAGRRAATARSPVYAYLFTHVLPGPDASRWKAFHSSEIPYVFGTLAASPERPVTTADSNLSAVVSSYWLNFITRGDPNGAGLPEWPALTQAAPRALFIDNVPQAKPLLRPETLALLREYAARGGEPSAF